MIDIDPRVEGAHGFVIQQVGQWLELGSQIRVGIEVGLTNHWRCGVVREVVLVVLQQLEMERVQATVGGVNQPGEHLAVTQRGVDQPGVHLADVFPGQVHAVVLDHADHAVGTVGELGVQGDQVFLLGFVLQDPGQIADGVDLRVLVGNFLRQRQGVGVAELRRR